MMLRCIAIAGFLVLGCASQKPEEDEFSEIGRSDSSSDMLPGLYPPIARGDAAAISERGVLLHDLQRTLALAYEGGLRKVGSLDDDVVMALTDVDPGGRSSQVMFVRWTAAKVTPQGAVAAEDATRWMLVSMLLRPDRVLDVELVEGRLEPGSDLYERAQAIIVAAEALRTRYPGQAFDMFTVFERHELRDGNKKRFVPRVLVRVYAMAKDGQGPDVEALLAPRRKKPPELLDLQVVQQAHEVQGDTIALTIEQPAAATVARLMARSEAPQSPDVRIRTRSGDWTVSPATGRVTRVGAP